MNQLHASGDVGGVRVAGGAFQRVGQQRGGHRRALHQGDAAAQTGQHKAIAAQAGGGVHHIGQFLGAFQAYGLGHRLAAAASLLAAMFGRALDEFRIHRAVFAGGQQFQSFLP